MENLRTARHTPLTKQNKQNILITLYCQKVWLIFCVSVSSKAHTGCLRYLHMTLTNTVGKNWFLYVNAFLFMRHFISKLSGFIVIPFISLLITGCVCLPLYFQSFKYILADSYRFRKPLIIFNKFQIFLFILITRFLIIFFTLLYFRLNRMSLLVPLFQTGHPVYILSSFLTFQI